MYLDLDKFGDEEAFNPVDGVTEACGREDAGKDMGVRRVSVRPGKISPMPRVCVDECRT